MFPIYDKIGIINFGGITMQYQKQVSCELCGKLIEMPHARVEWTGEHMHICHHDCSIGMRISTILISDMILDQLYSDPNLAYERLMQVRETNPQLAPKCEEIIQKLFVIV